MFDNLLSRWPQGQQPPFGGLGYDIGSAMREGMRFAALCNENAPTLYDQIGSQGGIFTGTTLPKWNGQLPDFTNTTTSNGGVKFSSPHARSSDLALGTNAFSVATRVYFLTGSDGGIARRNDANSVNAGWELHVGATKGMNLTVERASVNYNCKTAATITQERWTTLVMTYPGNFGGASFYYDTVSQTVSTTTGSGAQGSDLAQDFYLGVANFSNNGYGGGGLHGLMEYCYIWSRVLTATEIFWLQEDPYVMFREMDRMPPAMFPVAATATQFPSLWLAGLSN